MSVWVRNAAETLQTGLLHLSSFFGIIWFGNVSKKGRKFVGWALESGVKGSLGNIMATSSSSPLKEGRFLPQRKKSLGTL